MIGIPGSRRGIAAAALAAAAAVALILVLLLGGGTVTAHKPSSPTSTCQSRQLSLRHGFAGVAAGSVVVTALFTNTSASRCTLEGYPTLQLLSAAGTRLKTLIHRGASVVVKPARARLLTLAPGHHASFFVGFADATGYGLDKCPASARVAVVPPNDQAPITIAWRLQPYGGSTEHLRCGEIAVSPVVPGALRQQP